MSYNARLWTENNFLIQFLNCNKIVFIVGLTQQDIITAVNNVTKSPMYGYNFDYASLLGNFIC